MEPFDLLNSPLEGVNLIEASAGTGKTYTITGLFLRLLVEKKLSVDEILVVTFTEAATAELKDRIRTRLRDAAEVFLHGEARDDLLKGLIQKHGPSRSVSEGIRQALNDFDRAAVFTIHGFCRRTLYEHAFESGTSFDSELITDQEPIKREVVADFWRNALYNASPLFIRYALSKDFTPEELLKKFKGAMIQPYMKVVPQAEAPDTSQQEKAYRECRERVCDAWKGAREDVADILKHCSALKKNRYKKEKAPALIRKMDELAQSGAHDPILFNEFEHFTVSSIRRFVKKGYEPPHHPFFKACEALHEVHAELIEAFDARLLALKVDLVRELGRALPEKKRRRNLLSFDDLLLELDGALQREGPGGPLAQTLREKHKAALIDEFQDTDPIQYDIFRRVFASPQRASSGGPATSLFLIGDPKQAIYGFRGADIFAYMDARRYARRQFTLEENWRSEPHLIEAVNTVFTNPESRPFVYDAIGFQSVRAADRPFTRLQLEGEPEANGGEAPFHLWLVEAGPLTASDKPLGVVQARELLPEAVALEIDRLLRLAREGKAFLARDGGSEREPLREGHMAVLVRQHMEARAMREALAALNIPGVLYTTENLFDSPEAMEMERLLAAVAEPSDERKVKAAMTTDLLGMNGEDLARSMEDEAVWSEWLFRFHDYHDLWNRYGFIRMFRELLFREGVLARLMSHPDGERRSTNVLHLSEVLHRQATADKPGMNGLLKWLSEQRNPDAQRLEEHQLRLESDENAVRIVTIHKSKGLEYPVVFCPFTWSGSRENDKSKPLVFHDEADEMKPAVDLGSPERDLHRSMAEKEALAENLRLFYVALTRARNRCYCVWGRFNKAGTSAPAYLFHPLEGDEKQDLLNTMEARYKALTDEDLVEAAQELRERSGGSIAVASLDLGAHKRGRAEAKKVGRWERKSLESEISDFLTASNKVEAASSRVEARAAPPAAPHHPREAPSTRPGHGPELKSREFQGHIDRHWRISSFSALVSHRPHRLDQPDRDETAVEEPLEIQGVSEAEPEAAKRDIFAFPKGARAGLLLHEIFEHLDFTDMGAISGLVKEKLQTHGFDPEWEEAVGDMVRKVLAVPLDPCRPDFTLSRVPVGDRLNELEFYFPLKRINPQELASLFQGRKMQGVSGASSLHLEGLDFSPVEGFMKGFIDMVFRFDGRYYLVDWKSNYLGPRPENYDEEAMASAMSREAYTLQYHLYAVALHRYLQARLPGYDYDTHLGGVYYIFLRGVDPRKGTDLGVFRDRPSWELMSRLCERLIDE